MATYYKVCMDLMLHFYVTLFIIYKTIPVSEFLWSSLDMIVDIVHVYSSCYSTTYSIKSIKSERRKNWKNKQNLN